MKPYFGRLLLLLSLIVISVSAASKKAYCMNTSTTVSYDPSKQICCVGVVHTLNSKKMCCRSSYVTKTDYVCCNSAVNKMVPNAKCCHQVAYDSSLYKCKSGKVVTISPCGVFDSKKKICCESKLFSIKKSMKCCGNSYYLPTSYVTCCNNKVSKTIARNAKCCGDRAYATYLQYCKDGEVSVKSLCGLKLYTPSNYKVCCDKKLYNLRFPIAKCCGNSPYSSFNQYCSSNIIANKKYCGVIPYIPSSRTVCCNRRLSKLKFPTAKCCNNKPYSSFTQYCKSNVVMNKKFCGFFPYTPNSKSVCCNMRLSKLKYPTAKCCNKKSYSTFNQYCKSNVVANKKFCGVIPYIPNSRTVCCDKKLAILKNPTAKCCNKKPYSTLIQRCFNGRIISNRYKINV